LTKFARFLRANFVNVLFNKWFNKLWAAAHNLLNHLLNSTLTKFARRKRANFVNVLFFTEVGRMVVRTVYEGR
jgi:hypothetical protein